jgi:hypothetical protein
MTSPVVDTFTLVFSRPGQPIVSGNDPELVVNWPGTLVGLTATLTETGTGRCQIDVRAGEPAVSVLLNRLTIDADELTSETSEVPVAIAHPDLAAGTRLRFMVMSHGPDARGLSVDVDIARNLPAVDVGVFDPATIIPEVAQRVNVPADTPAVIEAVYAAVADVLEYSGRDELPDDPRVSRHMVTYAAAIFLSAQAPNGSITAFGDDTFTAVPVANDLSAKYAPRFAFLSTSWGIA